ncbi:MAG: adenylate/guanylate cyclase domain-containing protein [Alphaproteobacteria bacterium]
MNAVELLLRERERRGLRMMFIITLGLSAIGMTVNLLFLPDTPLKPYRYASWAVPVIGSLVSLYLLHKRQFVVLTGFIYAAIVVLYTAFIPISNYLAVGAEDYPASSLVLLVDYGSMELVIVATALTLRPVYPLVVAGGITVTYGGLLAYALTDPRTQIVNDYGVYLTSPAILPSREASIFVGLILTGLIIGTSVYIARRMVVSAVRLERANRHLSRYFSPNIIKRISAASAAAPAVGGRRQDVVVLFADLAGFTQLSAELPPEQALLLLSNYQRRMVDIIFANNGTLDKFTGDGLMATFGTPDPDPEAAREAVLSALGMQRALAEMNEDRKLKGEPVVGHRIGIHAGPAIVGNVGTSHRLEFTVIGNTVNVASRIEEACRALGEDILVTEAVKQMVEDDFDWTDCGDVTVDGQPDPIRVFVPKTRS